MNVVAAILLYQKKILCFKRGYSQNNLVSNKYEFPGGKVKKNESFKKALRRELKEELNLEVNKLNFFFKNDFSYPNFKVNLRFYISELTDLNFELKEHSEYSILQVNHLRSLEWLSADYPVIEYIEKNSNCFL